MFVVEVESCWRKIAFTQRGEVLRESATYSWPCEKHGMRKSSPTHLTDWPCALLIVSANARVNGNWRRRRTNPSSSIAKLNEHN
jgi:hypothetical protein